ncbi:Ni/Fe-hydrogenase, b-type cytochrome subunit [Sulfurimonas sp.]|jgi:Ni/Fe-hydrogenase 1 B-type cytochrome subunit|uniref:Ni/Fe-hydrogenase, b-type cytochrome subunit n=1 Tax=Sulfurimonas sp. TaxID=2022749 RepID=UPI0025CD87B2|nr:Ni/Fe-hydrogenase, b-type cytochrome subunit [Sulfurimonas sp.]
MNVEAQENVEMEQELEFAASYRWQHWIRAVSIVVLTVTGFYIAVPFLTPAVNADPTNFMQSLIRSWHIIFGFVLISVIIFKSYLFIFAKNTEMERKALKDVINPKIWIQQIGYYLLVSKHPKLNGVYNPLQFMAYVTFYIAIFVLIITGLIMYVHDFHQGLGGFLYAPMKSIEVMMGGLANVRVIHHILTWGIMLFVVGHMYMAIYNAVFGKEGAMDAIFSGMKWHKKH